MRILKTAECAKLNNKAKSLESRQNREIHSHQARILAERLKELNCLYTISKIFDKKGLTLDDVIRQMIQVIPKAWQYPGITGVQVVLGNKSFQTRKFSRSEWIQQCPVIVQGASAGTITVSYSEKRPEQDEGPFFKEERNLLNVIAQRLGDIIERKQSEQKLLQYQEELRSLATELALSEERERRRIAQALHDRIGQVLGVINIKVGALLESAPSKDLVKALQAIRNLVLDSVAQTRSLTFDLSPPILYELGLESALEWLAEYIQQQYSVEVTIVCREKEILLSTEWRVALFTAIRELLVNVGKHAKARTARVSVKRKRKIIIVSVEDTGIGMDPARAMRVKPSADGFGLFSIRERLGYMGGRFELSSKRRQGTRVTLFVPIEKLKSIQKGR